MLLLDFSSLDYCILDIAKRYKDLECYKNVKQTLKDDAKRLTNLSNVI